MEEYIFDGEIHAINDKYAYMMERIGPVFSEKKTKEKAKDLTKVFYRKYAEYLYKNDKEKTIEYLTRAFFNLLEFSQTPDGVSLIYREPHIASILSQYATFAMKFERAEKDNLDDN